MIAMGRRCGRRAAWAILALVVGCGETPAPQVEQFGPRPIALGVRLTLGELDGPGSIGRPAAIALGPAGSLSIVSEDTSAEIAHFDSDGLFRGRWGRTGEGPGEFDNIGELLWTGDSLIVFDIGNRRVTILSDVGEVRRTFRHSRFVHRAKVQGAGILTAGYEPGDSAVLPVQRLNGEFAAELTTGADPPEAADDFYGVQRAIAGLPDGRVVSASRMAYTIDVWSPSGTLEARWARSPEWMPPQATQIQMTESQRHHPELIDIHVDTAGVLWTMIRVNEPDWHRGLGDPVGSVDGQLSPIEDVDRVFGTRIEALDLANQTVLGSVYVPTLFVRFLADGSAASYEENSPRGPIVTIWNVTLGLQFTPPSPS